PRRRLPRSTRSMPNWIYPLGTSRNSPARDMHSRRTYSPRVGRSHRDMIRTAILFAVLILPGLAGYPLTIRLEGTWKASSSDILKVLHGDANPLWRESPDRDLSPIHGY